MRSPHLRLLEEAVGGAGMSGAALWTIRNQVIQIYLGLGALSSRWDAVQSSLAETPPSDGGDWEVCGSVAEGAEPSEAEGRYLRGTPGSHKHVEWGKTAPVTIRARTYGSAVNCKVNSHFIN